MRLAFSVNGKKQLLDTVPDSFHTNETCEEWSRGVLNNIRVAETAVPVHAGVNDLYFYAADPGIVLERIVLYPENTSLPKSYLGPPESWRTGGTDVW